MSDIKVLILGDSHGDAEYMLRAMRVARRKGCDRIFQIGDFGYYDHLQEGIDFMRRVEAGLNDHGLILYWTHGNHDGMVPLWSRFGLVIDGSDFSPHGGVNYVEGCSRGEFVKIRERVFYAPIGHRWEWGSTTFMAVGGAYSINRAHMIPGIEWWEEEVLTEDQVDYITEGDPVDVMLTHDCPVNFDLPAIAYKKEYLEAAPNRERLAEIVDYFRPQLLIHGHYHSRYGNWHQTRSGHRYRIEGLGSNRTAESDDPWVIMDLKDE